MKLVRFLQPAEQELLAAAAFYEARSPGLGGAFLRKVDRALADVATNPERWPLLGPGIRRRLVHRFPYSLVYRTDPDETVILAVAHLHRHPRYWQDRS